MSIRNNTNKNKIILLVTGEAGVGKSYISNKLEHIAKKKDIKLTNIEFDIIGHKIFWLLLPIDKPQTNVLLLLL